MSDAFICRRGTGGGSGATLVITGVAGDICTITKDGKSKTKTFTADGTATFKGLATGTWSVTMSNPDGDSVTQTIAINSDYSLTIAYFAATIAITYPAGSVCTCAKDSTTFTAPDTSGLWTCTVPSTGTWTVSCTDGTDSDSKTVDITTDGQSASVELLYAYILYDAAKNIKTGGWTDKGYGNHTVTWGDTELIIHSRPDAGPSVAWDANAYVYTSDLDLTDYSTAEITVTEVTGGWKEYTAGYWVGITNGAPGLNDSANAADYPNNQVASTEFSEAGVVEIDITSVTSGNICLFTAAGYGQWSNSTLHITKVLLK